MYNTIIFDLDGTLTDDKENVREAFKTILDYKNEEYSEEQFEKFYSFEREYWAARAEGKIKTPYEDDIKKKVEWIRANRFMLFFNNSVDYEEAVKMNHIYLEGMRKKVVARDGALEIIKYLYDKNYKLVVATNGPIVPLKSKLQKLQIEQYFNVVFSAEEVGYMKPKKPFYEGLLKKSGITTKENVLFIGDELEKDIKGGIENGIDTCWCNYDNEKATYKPTYEIHKLEELKKIL